MDTRGSQAHLTRRRLLKLTAAGAVGLGVASLTATAASAHTIGFQAPHLQASHITALVNSGDGVRVRALGNAYTSHTGQASKSSSWARAHQRRHHPHWRPGGERATAALA